nr:MAG TPA: hypothetical protein [Caudoviricetes sp.]
MIFHIHYYIIVFFEFPEVELSTSGILLNFVIDIPSINH